MNAQVRKLFLLFLFWFLILFGLKLKAENIIKIHDPNQLVLAGTAISYLEDEDGARTVADILQIENQELFQSHNEGVFNRPGTKSAFWFKVTVQNTSGEDAWLEVGSNYAWYIDFYAPDSTEEYTAVIQTGTMRPEENKMYDVNSFWLPLGKANETEPRTYYLRIVSGITFEMPMQVGTIRSLSSNKFTNDFLLAAFIGIVLVMLIYNTFIYLSTKDHIYIFYLGYLLFIGITVPYANGYPFIEKINFLFIDKVFWNEYFLLLNAPVYYFMGMFCIRYLELSTNGPWIKRLIQLEIAIISGVFPLLNILGIALVEVVNYVHIFMLIFYLTCLITAYFYIYKGIKQAYFYAFGWTFLILSAFIFIAVINGFLPFNAFTRNVLYFGTSLEVCLFSLALGDRLNILQKEKNLIKAQHLKFVEQQNEVLEEKVRKRTSELESTNENLVQSNEELMLTTEQLDAQSKQLKELNHTKDQLFAIISHDLRSPINSLKGLINLIWGKNISQEEFYQYSKKIKNGVEHTHFMLNNLLNWANSQLHGMSTNPEQFELYPQLLDIKLQLQELSENKNIEVSIDLDKNTMVYADRDHLNLVLRNLISNALKFTDHGGKVNIAAYNMDSQCQITIADTGVGISEDGMKDLFNIRSGKSHLGTRGEKGTGLGLILCKEFIEKNNGRLWIKSKKGDGTTIFVTLPINQVEKSSLELQLT